MPFFQIAAHWYKTNWPPLLIFLGISTFLIFKVFSISDCFAYDANDDRNHTFVNLTAAREILRSGEIPQINFFNNFGTPILGDALTYPFAPHAITYAFFSGPAAMTINRFVIALLTLTFLYVFFRNFYAKWLATLLSIFAFSTPGFLWHFAHHHYQMALLLAAIPLCLLAARYREKISESAFLILFFIASLLLIASVSIQVVLIVFAFLLAASFIFAETRARFLWCGKLFLLITAALLTTLPQTYSFFNEITNSTRASSIYVSQTAYETYNALNVALGLLTQARMGGGHIDIALYLSLPMLLAAFIGTWLLFRDPEKKKIGYLSATLGIIPLIAVCFLVAFPKIWAVLPLLKSTDITRIWWLSSIFLALGIGKFFEEFVRLGIERRTLMVVFLLTGIVFLGLVSWQATCAINPSLPIPCGDPGIIKSIHYSNLAFFFALIFLVLSRESLQKFFTFRVEYFDTLLFGSAITIFTLLTLPSFFVVLSPTEPCSGSHYFSKKERAGFEPEEFLSLMEPLHRLATEQKSSEGQDLTAIFGGILGSNGRSIIMNGELTDYLLKENLIEIDDRLSGYHFRSPWQAEKLERFGIRYVISQGRAMDLERDGWHLLGRKSDLFLYENLKRPTPFYLADKSGNISQFLRDYRIEGNSLLLRASANTAETTLVAAFAARPEWRAFIDGREIGLFTVEDRLLRLDLPPGAHSIKLSFAPYSWIEAAAYFASGLALLAVLLLVARKRSL